MLGKNQSLKVVFVVVYFSGLSSIFVRVVNAISPFQLLSIRLIAKGSKSVSTELYGKGG